MSYIFGKEATPGNIKDKYVLGEEIGTGNFSSVRRAVSKATGKGVAVKIIDKANVDVGKESLINEVKIMKEVEHPNIVRLMDVFETPRRVYLVMELLTGGELFDRIVNVYPNGYTEKDASQLIAKIIKALFYLHERGIVHRDLKPENLLYENETEKSEIKLTDFGLAKIASEDVMMKTACGTPSYVAPEVLLDKGYDEKVDMWSIGVVLYILLCGFPPFYSEHTPDLFDQIIQGEYSFPDPYWTHISASAKDIISRMLVVDPRGRLSPRDALAHPWIRGTTASGGEIPGIVDSLKSFRARRKFRMGIAAVIGAIRLSHAAKLFKK
eukprot:TRINITY_DN3398_c0_g1_i1.p1 TRINITY_DN3398_c0_g1~~TRINITY_DN3398_c0_g1_i1.p1  ORF type:complete len:325 (+),score=89.71 TRINITY_DN3398_c0_g1_i1:147-1121(+)